MCIFNICKKKICKLKLKLNLLYIRFGIFFNVFLWILYKMKFGNLIDVNLDFWSKEGWIFIFLFKLNVMKY